MPAIHFSPRQLALLALLWCTGVYLRVPILIAPPLAEAIAADLGLGKAAIGALTTLPVLMLALGAVPGAWFIGRLGPRYTVIVALALTIAASAARGAAPGAAALFAATAVMGLGIAAMQPALPALVTRWCPSYVAIAVAVYMNGMLMGEFLGAGLTLPVVVPLAGGNWRGALALWSLPALVVLAGLWLPARRGKPAQARAASPDFGDANIWRFGLLMGAASVLFFGTNAYMTGILSARGEGERLAETLLWFNLSQGVGSLAMLAFARRLVARRTPVAVTNAAGIVCSLLFLYAGGNVALAAAFVLGLATAVQLILLVAAAPIIAPPGQAGSVSAAMFAIGYGMAFAVPLAGGWLAQTSGVNAVALWPGIVYAAAALPLAWRLRFKAPLTRGRTRDNHAVETKP